MSLSKEVRAIHQLIINSEGKIFLDDKRLENVTEYELKHSAGHPAELRITLLATIVQVASELEKK